MELTDGAMRATAAITQSPLRWFDEDEGDTIAQAKGRGWFRGAAECARCLASITGAQILSARAFGGDWPAIHGADGWLVAPALPVALVDSGGGGADAEYFLRDSDVWREAAGIEKLFLTSTETGPSPGTPFDLLWFGDGERYSFLRGSLAVEDLFALVELSVDRDTLDRLLVRGRRVAPEVLEGLTFAQPAVPARITVNRAVALSDDKRWRDPERFLRAREDVEWTVCRDDRVEIHTVAGASAVFLCNEQIDGWSLCLDAGEYPLTRVSLRLRGDYLSLSAELHPRVDPLASGMRGRLAFDLRSDLVTLG